MHFRVRISVSFYVRDIFCINDLSAVPLMVLMNVCNMLLKLLYVFFVVLRHRFHIHLLFDKWLYYGFCCCCCAVALWYMFQLWLLIT